MCDNIILHKTDGTRLTLSNQESVAQEVGQENMVIDEYHPMSCLCPLDMVASAKKAGYTMSKNDSDGEYDPFDTHWYEINDNNLRRTYGEI